MFPFLFTAQVAATSTYSSLIRCCTSMGLAQTMRRTQELAYTAELAFKRQTEKCSPLILFTDYKTTSLWKYAPSHVVNFLQNNRVTYNNHLKAITPQVSHDLYWVLSCQQLDKRPQRYSTFFCVKRLRPFPSIRLPSSDRPKYN